MSDVRATTALTETLADIAKWYPATAQPPREAVSQTRTAHQSKPPLPADVLSTRRETVDLLDSWAAVVIDGRNLHPTTRCGRPVHGYLIRRNRWVGAVTRCGCPQARHAILDGQRHPLRTADVPKLTSFLAAHAEWLTDTAGQDPLRELGTVATALEQIVKQSRPRRVTVGPCPECDDEGHACTGMMTATVRKSDSLLPSQIRCSVDARRHVFEPHDWPALGRRMEAASA